MEVEVPKEMRMTKKEFKDVQSKINRFFNYFAIGLITGLIITLILLAVMLRVGD